MDKRLAYRSFISYIDRSREYYAAQGYSQPYTWAHYEAVPFVALPKSLAQCRLGLITTAVGEAVEYVGSDRSLYAMPSRPVPPGLHTDHLFWDKKATHTDDLDSFLPLNRAAEYVSEGRIGSLSPRFYGVPTDYSQRRTINTAAPQILEWCLQDGVDAVLLSAL